MGNNPGAHVVGRYAPSPTGALHLGNLRSALAAWLSARSRGGRFLLRVEDLDGPRTKAGAEERQLADLRALGIDWDEAPWRQSTRGAEYDALLAPLIERGLVYRCFCSRRDIREALSAPHADPASTRYPGTCAGLSREVAERRATTGAQFCWRLRAAREPRPFVDLFAGAVDAAPDDVVVRRADGLFAYQWACAVDDGLSGITEVVRGEDLLESGAHQAWVLECLGIAAPRYAHIPLMVGEDGRRLSKRDGDDDLAALAARGLDAEAVCGYLAWTLGCADRGQRGLASQFVDRFALDRIPRAAVVVRAADLDAFRQ